MDDINRLIDDNRTIDVINALGIENMNDLCALLERNFKFEISMNPIQWNNFENFLEISEADWRKIKYYDKLGNKSEELSKIPADKGGIYIYYIKPEGIPLDNYCCIMYVGRAHFGEKTQNLKKRINSYDTEARDQYKGRATIRQLFRRYREYLYVMYIAIEGNDNIDRMERELTMAIVPPANSDLFQKALKDERKMF